MRETLVVRNVVKYIAILFALFYFLTSGFGAPSTELNLGLYLLFTNVLCILMHPMMKKREGNKLALIVDFFILALLIVSILYWIIEYPVYAEFRAGIPTRMDVTMGLILIFLSFEVTRRVMGNVLAILGLIMFLQVYFGPYLPGIFAHRGVTIRQLSTYIYFTHGIFGTIVSTFATFVMPFLIFGAFLQHTGGGDFFINMATAAAGKLAGGPALVAVGGSAIFGSISGSPVSNVVATGTFTIPLMKRCGYKPEFAGAVEAAASVGGAFLPPVMGAGAFILATVTNTPYGTVVIMAITPALLYFFSVTCMVYFKANMEGLRGLPPEEIPVAKEIFKKGWYYIFTIVIIIVLLVMGYSPPMTAFGATVFLIICGILRKQDRFTLKKFLDTLETAAKSSLTVGATAGTLGIVMAGITLTGLGMKFSGIILSISGGNLFITVLLVAFIATILGMGLTITSAYLVLAILAAPSLTMLGVSPVVAHMICFWLSMTSNLTPPVCVSAFAGASIAGASPMRTGWESFKLGLFMYLMPIGMVYCPQLLIVGHNLFYVIEIILSYIFATIAFAAIIQGWLFMPLKIFGRLIFTVACALLAAPEVLSDVVGIAIFLAYAFVLWRQSKKIQPVPVI